MSLIPDKLGNPEEYSVDTYIKNVTQRNTEYIDAVKHILQDFHVHDFLVEAIATEEKRSVTMHIATTGSDGRLEKKGDITSPLEAMVLMNGIYKKTRMLIEEVLSNSNLFGQIEVKDLQAPHISYYNNNHQQSWPTRIFDAISIDIQNEEMILMSKDLLSQEIKNTEGKKIQEDVGNKLREYRRICENKGTALFKGKIFQHFDAEEGVLFYKPGEEALSSVKYGPLRAIQMFLAYKITQLIRTEMSSHKLIHRFPSTIQGKIDILTEIPESNISASHGEALKSLYNYFLWCYYLSEHAYSVQGENQVALKDKKQFQENLRDTIQLIKLRS